MKIRQYIIFVFLLVTTFLFGKLQGGFVSWFLFYSVLILSLYLWVINRYSLKNIKISRTFKRTRLTAGDDLEIEIEVWNRIEFPHSYITVIDHVPTTLISSYHRKKHTVYPWFRSKSFIRYRILSIIRGVHKWREVELVSGDIFGLIQIRRKFILPSEVIVYPKSIAIAKWYSRNERNTGKTFSQNRTSEDTASVVGIREYRKGDRFNRIHWRQSAKSMKLMTKEFERLITNDFMFILNQEEAIYNPKTQLEYSIELTASLIRFSLGEHFSTGYISEGSIQKSIGLSRGKEHMLRIFEILAMIESDSKVPYTETIKSELPNLPLGVTLVLITPKINDDLYYLLGELAIKKIKAEVFVMVISEEEAIEDKNLKILSEWNVTIHFITINNWENYSLAGGISID